SDPSAHPSLVEAKLGDPTGKRRLTRVHVCPPLVLRKSLVRQRGGDPHGTVAQKTRVPRAAATCRKRASHGRRRDRARRQVCPPSAVTWIEKWQNAFSGDGVSSARVIDIKP